ncbi:hypothetical protein ACQ4PT_006745 [Festuca glaucescens]
MERYISTDVLVEILQRLPISSRRRARLVCRQWRDVVNNRTREMQSRPKLLIWETEWAAAHVADDLSPSSTGSCTELWRTSDPRNHYYGGLQLVGTCNGLLCLCDNSKMTGGAITLFNPATGETLPVPPLRCPGLSTGHHNGLRNWDDRCKQWGDAYSFAYHPTTGQYKVLHAPCRHECGCNFDAVHVITLGDGAWREVPAGPGGAMCKLKAGVVGVDGTVYWVRVTGDATATIAAFDLMDEQLVSAAIPPIPVQHDQCRLTEVHGRLGLVASRDFWVLEEGRPWSHRYSFEREVPRGHLVYGEYVLTRGHWSGSHAFSFHLHRSKGAPSSSSKEHDVVLVGHPPERGCWSPRCTLSTPTM